MDNEIKDYSEIMVDFEKLIADHNQENLPKQVVLSFMIIAYNQGITDGI